MRHMLKNCFQRRVASNHYDGALVIYCVWTSHQMRSTRLSIISDCQPYGFLGILIHQQQAFPFPPIEPNQPASFPVRNQEGPSSFDWPPATGCLFRLLEALEANTCCCCSSVPHVVACPTVIIYSDDVCRKCVTKTNKRKETTRTRTTLQRDSTGQNNHRLIGM